MAATCSRVCMSWCSEFVRCPKESDYPEAPLCSSALTAPAACMGPPWLHQRQQSRPPIPQPQRPARQTVLLAGAVRGPMKHVLNKPGTGVTCRAARCCPEEPVQHF
eukprot:scaffold167265_cov17-Tisochrysis_lutea.AAC.2